MRNSNTSPVISMIIPVYNVEPYLRRCFDSVLAQTFTDYEVLIIDDGSTDGSTRIVEEYAQRYEHFHAILLETNNGNGPARNLGLARARGEYIAFMDSDDYIERDFMARMLAAAEAQQADIVMCQYQILRPNGYVLYKHPGRNETLTAQKALRRLYRDMSMHHFVWNKLYKRSLFEKCGFSFPKMIFEDIASVHELFHQANRIVLIRDILYHYCQRKNSIFATVHPRRLTDNVKALAMTKGYLERHHCFHDYRSAYHFALTRNLITITVDIALMHSRERTPGLWKDWKHYWNCLLTLYDRTPALVRRKTKAAKENLPIQM